MSNLIEDDLDFEHNTCTVSSADMNRIDLPSTTVENRVSHELQGDLFDDIENSYLTSDFWCSEQKSKVDILVIPFCESKNIYETYKKIFSLIPRVFKSLKNFTVDFLIDLDSDQGKIIFNLSVEGNIDLILEEEDLYYKEQRKFIKSNERQYFSIVYSVY